MSYRHVLKWGAIAGAGALAALVARRVHQTKVVPAELRSPTLVVSPPSRQ